MLCSKLHCQESFKLKRISYEILDVLKAVRLGRDASHAAAGSGRGLPRVARGAPAHRSLPRVRTSPAKLGVVHHPMGGSYLLGIGLR